MPITIEAALRRVRPTIVLSAGFSPAVSGRVGRTARRAGIPFGVWSGRSPLSRLTDSTTIRMARPGRVETHQADQKPGDQEDVDGEEGGELVAEGCGATERSFFCRRKPVKAQARYVTNAECSGDKRCNVPNAQNQDVD